MSEPAVPSAEQRPTRQGGAKAAAVAAATGVLAVAAGAAVSRWLIQRARNRPDPEREEPLAERPGREVKVTSFDGTALAVNVVGPEDAPTLVFSHGFSLDMTCWHYQWKELSARYRCVMFDQRGHGRSSLAPEGDYSVRALGRDLKAVLDATAPAEGRVALIGHSMGGMAMFAFAEVHPEEFGPDGLVGAVVLANTAAADLLMGLLGGLGTRLAAMLVPGARLVLRQPDRIHRMRTRAIGKQADLAFLVTRLTNFGPKAPPSLVEYVVGVAAQAPAEVWTDLLGSLVELDLAHALKHIAVPSLLIVGDVDRLTPPSSALALKGGFLDRTLLGRPARKAEAPAGRRPA